MVYVHIKAQSTWTECNDTDVVVEDDIIVKADSVEEAGKDWHDFNVQAKSRVILVLQLATPEQIKKHLSQV